MDNEPNDPEFQEIARLIHEEETAALEAFRRQDFRRKVKDRIEAYPDRARPHLFSWKLAFPIGAAAFLLIAAGVVLFDRRPPVPYAHEATGSFLAGLRGLPRLTELAEGQGVRRAAGEEARLVPRSIQDVLSLAQERQRSERELAVERPPSLKVPRLSMEQKMTILFKERTIERVLILVRKKSEEV